MSREEKTMLGVMPEQLEVFFFLISLRGFGFKGNLQLQTAIV